MKTNRIYFVLSVLTIIVLILSLLYPSFIVPSLFIFGIQFGMSMCINEDIRKFFRIKD